MGHGRLGREGLGGASGPFLGVLGVTVSQLSCLSGLEVWKPVEDDPPSGPVDDGAWVGEV